MSAEKSKPASNLDRRQLSFEQAEGVEPLPAQLKPKELSKRLRALLWLVIYGSFETHSYYSSNAGRVTFLQPWEQIFFDMHVYRDHEMIDDFENDFQELSAKTRNIIEKGNYIAVFGWIEWVLRQHRLQELAEDIDRALVAGRAAYRVLDGDTIVPIGSEAEAETIKRAFADVSKAEFHGARSHLRNAATELTGGRFPDSIRESIHAVESTVRAIEPQKDFSKALAILEKKLGIHGALKSGFASIYGYTSDENGIRHPLLDDPQAKVDATDALFMIGACAAFVSYLINKARPLGML
jgi:hypothetical protein